MNRIATIKSSLHKNDIIVETDGNKKEITIPAKASGRGSSVNGAVLLFLSLVIYFVTIFTGKQKEGILLSRQ